MFVSHANETLFRKSPLSALSDKKGMTSGVPHLASLDPLTPSKRSPPSKIPSNSKALSSDELSHDSLSAKKRHAHDRLEDSFEQSLDEKLEDSKDGFEISSSFENSDINFKQLDSPLSKQPSQVLAPLNNDTLSPFSTKSDKEKSFNLEDSQPEELASSSFL